MRGGYMKRQISLLIAVFLIVFLIMACGGGGGGGDTSSSSPSPTDPSTPSPTTPSGPVFSGFDFTLATGSFWEYRWDYYKSVWGSGSTTDAGRFWVVLGQPLQIQGTTAYEIQLYGKSKNKDHAFAPRWKYLAIANNKILGSTDGTTLTTIFDAQRGYWLGGGFFFTVLPTTLIAGKNSSISNDYLNAAAIKAGRSASKSECEHYPGIGQICDDNSYDYTESDYFREEVGCLGYYYYNSYTDCGGGFCSGATWKHNVGLTASSFTANTLPLIQELEPNNSPSAPQSITFPGVIRGDCRVGDANYHLTLPTQNPPDKYVEDWYRFTLTAPKTIKISLDFEAYTTADLDLYLFDNSSTPALLAFSGKDNPTSKDQNETITKTLPAGTYRIGVDAYATPLGLAKYTLQVE
jgi:hypothetical protein